MKKLNYFKESDDHGYIFDSTVFDQEELIPIWDEHSYECIASMLVESMGLESLAHQIVATGLLDPNDLTEEAVEECYDEVVGLVEDALDELWEMIKDNPNQIRFVNNRPVQVLFDNTFTTDMGEFSIYYGDRETLCGTSATFIWRCGLSGVL